MLLFSGITGFDLEQINEIRKAHPDIRERSIGGQEDNIELTFPHDLYYIGLSSLQGNEEPDMQYSGTRIIEVGNNSFNFIYDIHKGFVLGGPQMFKDKKVIEAYEKAFETISADHTDKNDVAVRIVNVPAVYVEALWLHDEANTAADRFLLVRSVSLLENFKFYEREKFFEFLRRRARQMSDNSGEQRNENDEENGLELAPA
jgi:hypothetical protein